MSLRIIPSDPGRAAISGTSEAGAGKMAPKAASVQHRLSKKSVAADSPGAPSPDAEIPAVLSRLEDGTELPESGEQGVRLIVKKYRGERLQKALVIGAEYYASKGLGAAQEFVLGMPAGEISSHPLDRVLLKMDGFLPEWTEFLQNHRRRFPERTCKQALMQVFRMWSAKDPDGAIRKATPLGGWSPAEKSNFLQWGLFNTLEKEKPERLEGLLAATADPALRDFLGLTGNLVQLRIKTNFPQVVKELSDAVPECHGAAVQSISREIAALPDPASAMTAIAGKEGDVFANLLKAGFSTWARQDLNRALGWLDGQPRDARRDRMILDCWREIVDADSEAALRWADTVSDPRMRAELETSLREKMAGRQ